MAVSHTREIHYVSHAFKGRWNDKSVAMNDPFIRDLIGGKYKDCEFQLLKENGDMEIWKGLYLVTDGGFFNYSVFVNPYTTRFSRDYLLWSEWLESVRKDVECTFGILKVRFRFLRNAVSYHNASTMENAFKTAAILHNMLLRFDGYDTFEWEHVDPEAEDDEDDVEQLQEHRNNNEPLLPHLPANALPIAVPPVAVHEWRLNQHFDLREALVKHFYYCYVKGKVLWPREFTREQRLRLSIPRMPQTVHAIRARVEEEAVRNLYASASLLRRKDRLGNYTTTIGHGLFSNIRYAPTHRIASFKGEVISATEYNRRCDLGKGGYAIHINVNAVLDCYNFKGRECMASMANSPLKCLDLTTNKAAQANAKLVTYYSDETFHAYLQATCVIEAHTEILWPYSKFYKFPT